MSFRLGLFYTLLATTTSMVQAQQVAKGLIYSATADFRHDSIPTAIQALKDKGPTYSITFDNTEDQTWFKNGSIHQYDVLVFLDNTGQVLDDSGEAALQNYVNLGGNFVGIHSASDCQRNSTFFEKELGAHFDYHPTITNATVDVIDASHPSTSMLPTEWQVFDEMYNFKSDPRSVGAIVILSANESSYSDPGPRKFNQGTPHPTAWYQEHGAGFSGEGAVAGRSFYTSLGHTNETWMDDLFMAHVMGGISWSIQSNTTKTMNSSALVGPGSSSSSASNTSSSSNASNAQSSSPASPTNTTSGSSRPLSLSMIAFLASFFVATFLP
ncbi:trehalose utilization-domain-containing protein [Abortiporus biennis]|nr:trehalose utilization-domain-containing protein [Abortiporus biennis]